MRSIFQDLRFAWRHLRKAPSFTVTSVVVLALGLGANIAVFTLLSGILLRPLPYAHPERIVAIDFLNAPPFTTPSYANMLQLRDAIGPQLKTGAVIISTGNGPASVVGPGGRFQVSHSLVSAGLFDMLGIQPILGRAFRADENDPGKNHVVLIGEDVWQKLFHADPHIIGATLTIRQQPFTIVGVLPRGFLFLYSDKMAIWSPAEIPPAAHSAMIGKGSLFGPFFARLPEGMNETQLAAALSRTQAVIAKEVPGDQNLPTAIKVTNYQQSLTADARKPLLLLYAVVLGIWGLACLNISSLMLSRAIARTREHAVRAALGASRARLLQQSVVESLLISLLGAAFGFLIAQTSIKLLWRRIENDLPLTFAVHVDWRVVSALASLTLLTTLIAGIFPAIRAMRRDVRDRLNGITTTSGVTATRTREMLVVAQLSLTVVFLVGAGLFLRTIHNLRQVPLGFAEQNVLTGGIILNGGSNQIDDIAESSQNDVVRNQYLPLLDKLRAIPGVKVAALSSVLPMRSEMMVSISTSIDHKKVSRNEEAMADGRLSSPGLVEALGIPMVRGRFFSEDDTATAAPVAVVNEAFAKKYLPNQDPVGHTVEMGKDRFDSIRIVGVVADMKQMKLNEPTRPEIYFPLAQAGPGAPLYGIAASFIEVAIRGAVPADSLRAQFDKALHEVAPDATTTDVKTIHQAVEDSFGSQLLIARLLEGFAVLALTIACVGLYGLLSFTVAQRTREIGVRLALGAPQANIVSLVLRRAVLLLLVGIATGSLIAWFAARLANAYIFGVSPHDALVFTAVIFTLTAASLVAAWLPAQRAATVDPILALRSE